MRSEGFEMGLAVEVRVAGVHVRRVLAFIGKGLSTAGPTAR